MRGGKIIDWTRMATGIVAYEQPFAALDTERFERIANGFGGHYEVEWLSPDAFRFARGEGYSRLPRLDAFGYVDHGTVTRLRNVAVDIEDETVAVLPAGWRALGFSLDIRVSLVFWLFLLGVTHFALFDRTPVWWWVAGFVGIAALHVMLVMRSLDAKLARWMARSTWH